MVFQEINKPVRVQELPVPVWRVLVTTNDERLALLESMFEPIARTVVEGRRISPTELQEWLEWLRL